MKMFWTVTNIESFTFEIYYGYLFISFIFYDNQIYQPSEKIQSNCNLNSFRVVIKNYKMNQS